MYNKNLKELQERVSRRQYLLSIKDSLYDQREELRDKVEILDKKRLKEQKDVDRIEGRSLAAFFYEVVGKQEEKLSKERKEAYEALVKYEAALRELEMVDAKIDSSETELEGLSGCEEEYQSAFEKRLEEVKNSGIAEAGRVFALSERIARIENQLKEMDEAIQAGIRAKEKAEDVVGELDSAKGWGVYDMLGGGMISGMIKHDHINHAQDQIEDVQLAIRAFNTELADVVDTKELKVNIGEMLRFADFLFDGLFVDMMVQDEIEQALTNMQEVVERIVSVLEELEERKGAQEAELENIQAELEGVVVKLS